MCKIACKSPYASEEWKKIERLASVKGKIYKTAKGAKCHIEDVYWVKEAQNREKTFVKKYSLNHKKVWQ